MDGSGDTARGLDLDINLGELARPGRRPKALSHSILRPLQPSDLALLATEGSTKPAPLKKLGDRHHALARLLANGASESEAGVALGFSGSRVSILKSDPTFKELLEFYRDKVDLAFITVVDNMAGLSSDIVSELRDRLEEDPDSFKHEDLRKLLETVADRSGAGPTRKEEVSVNINLSDRLTAARKRALEARQSEIIDITPEQTSGDQSLSGEPSASSSSSLDSDSGNVTTQEGEG